MRLLAMAAFDSHGHVLGRFGHFGVYDGQFVGAHDVATSTDGAIYVVEAGGYRVQKFVPGR